MFLNEDAKHLIQELRNNGADPYKALICDAMSIIMLMYQVHASTEREKDLLIGAIDTLTNYNQLITALSKEK